MSSAFGVADKGAAITAAPMQEAATPAIANLKICLETTSRDLIMVISFLVRRTYASNGDYHVSSKVRLCEIALIVNAEIIKKLLVKQTQLKKVLSPAFFAGLLGLSQLCLDQ
jgi:hypothetical protein